MKQLFDEKYFYTYKFLDNCMPIYALYMIFFREKGLSLFEISLLLSFWSLVSLISEIPSGILADRWNRKYMLFIGTILKAVCYIVWCFSGSFFMFALGFLFWGISSSFMTGTEEGLLYDNLKSENRESDFSKVYGKGRFYSSLGIIVGIISGGILAHFISIRTISIASSVILIINLFFVSILKEKNYYSERLKKESIRFFDTFIGAVKICLNNSRLFLGLIILVFVISIISSYSDEYDPLIINDFGLGYIWVSVIMILRFAFIAMGERFASSFEKKFKSKNFVLVFSGLASVLYLIFSIIWNQYALMVFGFLCMIMTVAEVIQIKYIQEGINEEGRTTVMSIYGMLQNVVMIFYSTFLAFLTNAFSLRICYILISVYCIIRTAIMFIIKFIVNNRTKPQVIQ
jgi:MFS family permease